MDLFETPKVPDEVADENYSDEEDNAYFDPTFACDDGLISDEEAEEKDNANKLSQEDVLTKFNMDLPPNYSIPKQMCENRLYSELKIIYLSELVNEASSPFHLSIVDNDIKKWHLKITKFPEPCKLNTDLAIHYPKNPSVLLELSFPPEYPIAPPLVRVLSPAIREGHVILGGVLLLDVLTPSKCQDLFNSHTYSPAIQLLGLFNQLSFSMVEGNARVDTSPNALGSYSFERAKFMRDSVIGLMELDWEAVFEDFSAHHNNKFPRLTVSTTSSSS